MNPLSPSGPNPAPSPRWWQRASVLSLFTVVFLVGGAMAWSLWRGMTAPGPAAASAVLPWQIEPTGDGGSRVFDLTLGKSTLADVQLRFPDDLTVGLIAPNGQPASLEALVESFRAGFVTGKLVLAFDAEPGWLQRARERAPRNEVGEGGRSRRYLLAEDDGPQALASTLKALAFMPSARLDEATVAQRFGPPGERLVGPDGEVQLLYPKLGVAVVLPPASSNASRTVIQYTAPRDFEQRLRAPLLAASAPH
jgi:hypothetical protein